MPAASIDTFFACSLMVLLSVSAMAVTSKILYPYLNNTNDENLSERYREISKHLLLNAGTPSDWGENGQAIPEAFGLARAGSEGVYDLDMDKVSRLNSQNLYALSYAQMFTILGMTDVSFSIAIKPIFDVTVNLTATYAAANDTVYEFEITTRKSGSTIPTNLRCYVVAEDYLRASSVYSPKGREYVNVTLSNSMNGPALLVVFAASAFNDKIQSFSTYVFAHNSAEPKPSGTFLSLSPLNYTLHASYNSQGLSLSGAYALTFYYALNLTRTAADNQSATYGIPHFADSSPILTIATGHNSTEFFSEWTTYPQIPLQAGANFDSSSTLSDVFAYTYTVTINSGLYECTVWVGGPRE